MSAWTDRILREFPADLSRFWIACDPDDLLLDERILHGLRERGFEVLPFEDPVAFRTEYEERYRAAWDRGEEGTSKALVLQLRGTDLNTLPWDYVRMGRKVSLSLADLFPRLSYGVVRQMDSEHHEALFLAHNKHATQPLGEGATKDFILTHIFRISPYLLSRAEDFWREVLRLHFRGAGLPDLLARHVAGILKDTPLSDLATRLPGFSAEEGGCFAWLPTLTSVSRQAIFSGLKPREFSNSIETTSQEPSLWARFWQENGLRKSEIVYQKGLKRTEQLAELEDAISKPATRVAGVVVDMVDEIVHGAMLGKRGIAGQINAWCETGFVEKLFLLLAEQGYQIYLTADHGNVDAEGIGRLSQGVVSELRGERVRTYRSETLAASVPSEINAFRFDCSGLPPDFLPVYASTRGAFVPMGDHIVAHGGISVEELIVPFIKINIKRPAS